MLRVKIASPQEAVPLDRGRLREVARAVLEGEGVAAAAVSLALVDNPTIHRLNKQFLDHDEPTDVLTFPLSGPGAKTLEGEVVIGAEVARAQAYYATHEGKGRVTMVGSSFNSAPIAFMMQLDSPLRRPIDLALLALRENGTYQQLYDKWFGGP